jgi:hypothetical protein
MEEIAVAKMAIGLERRKQRRYECEGPADVFDTESRCVCCGEIRDLSLTGCYIHTESQLDLERRADVELHLRVNGDSLDTPARVIVVRPESGAAFEFLAVDPEMRSALLALIQKLASPKLSPELAEAI